MPSPSGKKKSAVPNLVRAGFLFTGIVLLARLGVADPDFNLMAQLAGERFGMTGVRAISEWQQFLSAAKDSPENEKLLMVNDFINRKVRFSSDQKIWGKTDYWATPLETLGRGEGDCEDFSIAKYATLKLLGIPGDKLRMVYVKARIGGMGSNITQAHMVLSYYPKPTAEPLILDNLAGQIRPASQRKDLYPVFSFSIEDLWVGTSPVPAASATARLSSWRDVLSRMQKEGLKVLLKP
jgi:predicted transglutaminase-like cysteine proteinase